MRLKIEVGHKGILWGLHCLGTDQGTTKCETQHRMGLRLMCYIYIIRYESIETGVQVISTFFPYGNRLIEYGVNRQSGQGDDVFVLLITTKVI